MKIKECYVSQNGISCFTNINTMHDIKNIKFDNITIKSNFIYYLGLRLFEFIINDFFSNKQFLFNNNNSSIDELFLSSFIYE